MTIFRTVLALGMAAFLSLTMPAASTVFPGSSLPDHYTMINGGSPDGHVGFIPPSATSETADIPATTGQSATCPAQIEGQPPVTLQAYKDYVEGANITFIEVSVEDFVKNPAVEAAVGPAPAEMAKYTVVFADPRVNTDLITIVFMLYDDNGCFFNLMEIPYEIAATFVPANA